MGGKVTSVEIREIEPPREIQAAMNRQMSAERNRRAMVLEADGQREASIKVAEGEKQASILRAEGNKQSDILQAEGQRTAQALRAEGYAVALQHVFAVAQQVDPNTMTVLEVVEDPALPPGLVIEEVRRGYYWKAKVFRFAEVRAVQGRASNED